MARYIDADELEKHFKVNVSKHILTISDNDYPVFLTDHTLHEIRNAPTADVVSVVRCLNCKNSKKLQDPCKPEIIFRFCLLNNGFVNSNHYCSYGERSNKKNDKR